MCWFEKGLKRKISNEKVAVFIAVIISSVAFGLMHNLFSATSIPYIISGVCYALVYKCTGSIDAAIIAHCIHNVLVFF